MDKKFERVLSDAVESVMPRAESMFAELDRRTKDGAGVTRPSYLSGEQVAHDIAAGLAGELGLETVVDAAGNLYMTMPGADRNAARWITGSHMDSVAQGGNYDGAAGVVAGLMAVAALRRAGIKPHCDITVMAIRAEESNAWFTGRHDSYLGSRAALGMLKETELETAVHVATGKTLRTSMAEAGFDPEKTILGVPYLNPRRIAGYVELHIEQGPILETEGYPVGVVSAIAGNRRVKSARVTGEYTHSGGVPQNLRHDAVLAVAEFLNRFEEAGLSVLADGRHLVFTCGKLYTDPKAHGLTKVPGQVDFTLDVKSLDVDVLDEMQDLAQRLSAEISMRRGVAVELNSISRTEPVQMNEQHRECLHEGCRRLEIPAMDLPSGAGHDAQVFHEAGIPTSMIFVRNSHGSHNPAEAMTIADFSLGARALAWMLATPKETQHNASGQSGNR